MGRQRRRSVLRTLSSSLKPVKVTANSISQVLYTSNGREAFLALLQYCAELYKECMKDYISFNAEEHWQDSVQNARSVEHSMSSGRKIIRLFRFLDEVGSIQRLLTGTGSWQCLSVLKVLSHSFSFLYFTLDNLVLASKIGIISHVISPVNIRWKSTKDLASLLRVLLELAISLISLKSTSPPSVFPYKSPISSLDFIKNRLEMRTKRRFLFLNLVQNGLRVLMLGKALELPGHRLFSPILIAVIGVLTTAISVFKRLIESKSL